MGSYSRGILHPSLGFALVYDWLMIDQLILTVSQPHKGYFVLRAECMAFIVYS